MNALRLRSLFTLLIALFAGMSAAVQAGSGLAFDGVNDYVTFGSAPSLGTAKFTIETWFKRQGVGVSTSTGYGGIDAIPLVTKGRAEVDGSNKDMNYFLGIRPSDNVLIADFEEGATGTSPGLNHPVSGKTPIAQGIWYHAAVTYDGAKWQLFLNGALEAELAVGQPPRSDSIQHAALGSALDSTGAAAGFFNGVLDEVRIWNYARTAADIAANQNLEITSAVGLIGRWGLNEATGTTATSSSGSGTIGTLVNGPTWTSGFVVNAPPAVTRGPYLQTGTPTSLVIRWRTNVATDSRVRFGTAPDSLIFNADDTTATTEHQVKLTGLSAGTRYYYSVGSSTVTLAGGADFTFQTSPLIGSSAPTRIWVIGDSGEGTPAAATVRDSYLNYTGTRATDVWLMLGDNAYENGTDAEYQTTLFDMYARPLRNTILWPTIGNHDTAESGTPPATLPYFNIFSLPANGEAGGVASATNRYYSFDYGSIHFICLDSMTSDRQPGGAMLTWLQRDLAATTQPWLIAYWHHAPYSRGIIDSDTDPNCTDMRQNVVPILEKRGVDLVLAGHSHDYERSYLLNGHYGFSSTFTSAMIMNAGNGREDGAGAYRKPTGLSANKGAVYNVVGSSAETRPGPLNYPAMFTSEQQLGSLVIDVVGDRLDARFLRETGVIDDYFTIRKDVANSPPSVALSSPVQNATFAAPASISVTASPTDSDGFIKQVEFYAGSTLIGSSSAAPWSIVWSNVPTGSYSLTAVASDNLGATATSTAVTISVTSPIPAAPGNLKASAISRKGINLAWTDNSTNESGFYVYRSSDNVTFVKIATLSANTMSYSSIGLAPAKTYYYRVSAFSSAGESAPSNTASATTSR
ncbi:MAG: metallophosphoesterase [Verrucomicrobiota bacterium]|nr:metallophosphoesterase [Verrucomicrobiota bacterium]